MKILLTLFVLLFSSSVLADDLSGNKIFCKITENNSIELIGIEFHSSDRVKFYSESNKDKLSVRHHKYLTTTSEIQIITSIDDLKMTIYRIDRRNLEIKSIQTVISGANCKLVNDKNIKQLFVEALKKEKSKNVL